MAENKTRGIGRTRSWTFILYPESVPKNWRNILDDEHIEWIESPLHDKDFNADGSPKKAHWHILLMFESVKDYKQVKEITDKLNAPMPQKCNGAKGLVRYMAHLDNPEKVLYDRSLIIGHGGADVAELLKPSTSERYCLIKEMKQWVLDNQITEFCDLFDFAAEHHFDDWFPLLCDNSAYIMGEFIKSIRHKPKPIVDDKTGEILDKKED